MNAITDQTLRYITSGLTGRREKDIVFLQDKIEEFRYDLRISEALQRILRCLTFTEINSVILSA